MEWRIVMDKNYLPSRDGGYYFIFDANEQYAEADCLWAQ